MQNSEMGVFLMKEKGQLDSTENAKRPWYAKYEPESDMDIALRGTTSP
jgi:hypothetical protein